MQERVFKLRLPMQHCPYVAVLLERQGWTIPFYKVKLLLCLRGGASLLAEGWECNV